MNTVMEKRYLRGFVARRRDGAQRIFRLRIQLMKVSYFEDTDTLYIELRPGDVVETRDLDENTVLDLDAGGHVCAMTFEHASQRTDVKHLVVEGIAA
jgi:uncharacterized protein YuzE